MFLLVSIVPFSDSSFVLWTLFEHFTNEVIRKENARIVYSIIIPSTTTSILFSRKQWGSVRSVVSKSFDEFEWIIEEGMIYLLVTHLASPSVWAVRPKISIHFSSITFSGLGLDSVAGCRDVVGNRCNEGIQLRISLTEHEENDAVDEDMISQMNTEHIPSLFPVSFLLRDVPRQRRPKIDRQRHLERIVRPATWRR